MPSQHFKAGEPLEVRNIRESRVKNGKLRFSPPRPRGPRPPSGRYAAAARLQPRVMSPVADAHNLHRNAPANAHQSPSVAPAMMDVRASRRPLPNKRWYSAPLMLVVGIVAGIAASIVTIELYATRLPVLDSDSAELPSPAPAVRPERPKGPAPALMAPANPKTAPAAHASEVRRVINLDDVTVPRPLPSAAGVEQSKAEPTSKSNPSTRSSNLEPNALQKKTNRASTEEPKIGTQQQAARDALSAKAAPAPEPRTDERPFDREAARAALGKAKALAAACGDGSGPMSAPIAIRFAPSGRATTAIIEGTSPLRGSKVGSCVAQRMRQVQVPAFSGEYVTVHTTVSVK